MQSILRPLRFAAFGGLLALASIASAQSLMIGEAPSGTTLPAGQGWLPVEGDPRHSVRVPDYSKDPVHPRLFFGPDDIPALRERAQREPFASMVAAMERATVHDAGDNPSYTAGWQLRNHAFLYLLTGDPAHAEAARVLVERLRAQDWNTTVIGTWYPSDGPERRIRHLNLTQGSLAVALAYDWCYDAWPEDFRRTVSRELAEQARVQLDTWGEGYPTQGRANNWRGIRFAGAGIALLASDEPHLSEADLAALAAQGINPMSRYSAMHGIDPRWLQAAYELVAAYLHSGLTSDTSARGQNIEGHGYVLYPWRLIAPFLLSLERLAGMDIRLDRPAVGWNTQLIAMGAVPIPTSAGPLENGPRLGLRPDLSNDNPDYTTQGTLALSFPFLSPERRAAMRWHYDRFAGELGTGDHEMEWGGAVWAFLYYPDDLDPVNPATAWGLTTLDRPTGTVVLRNRFADENDTVVMLTARGRGVANQTHFGADISSLRIIGEGGFFATGSGRTTQVAGQSTVLRSAATGVSDNRFTAPGNLTHIQLREDGSGSLTIAGSATTVSDHIRRVLVDYAPDADGPSALLIVSDESSDGDLWRLNTPDFNSVTIHAGGFLVTAPNGSRLLGTVHYPANAVIQTGTYNRQGTVHYRGLASDTSNWVQVVNGATHRFVISLQVLAEDAEAATVHFDETGSLPLLQVGDRSYTVRAGGITASDWPANHTVAAGVVPAGSGSVTGTGTFAPGATTALVATPAPGFVFAGWESGGPLNAGEPTGFRPHYTLQVARDVSTTARFLPLDESAAGDGLPAALGSVLGLDPLAAADPRAWYAVDRDAAGRLHVSFRRDALRTDLPYRVEASEDLSEWTVLYDSVRDAHLPNTHIGRMRISAPAGWERCFVRLGVAP